MKSLAGILMLAVAACTANGQTTYLEEWRSFKTELIRKEKSFQRGDDLTESRDGIEPVVYQSDGMQLKALLAKGPMEQGKRKPAVVFLHGGFALSYAQMERVKPFTDAGFVVLAPSWRGENGNPGYFEAFFGEVRDAKAAIRWLARQDYVNPDRIYAFGWSVGGGIALNLSLHGDIPLPLTGSSAGLYDLDLIQSWATEDDYIQFPYDYRNERENYFRLPVYNLTQMVRPHITYIGEEDGFGVSKALVDGLYNGAVTKLELVAVPGDHMSSVAEAMRLFIKAMETGNAGK